MNVWVSKHQLPCRVEYIEPALSILKKSWGESLPEGLPQGDQWIGEVRRALQLVIENNRRSTLPEDFIIEVKKGAQRLGVDILNKGEPIYFDELAGHLPTSPKTDSYQLRWNNMGRLGQCVSFQIALPLTSIETASQVEQERWSHVFSLSDLEVRRLQPGEESALSRLFYNVYGYQYINDVVYYPERLRLMMEDGSLESWVATDSRGHLAGHVGLVRKNSSPVVYEAAMGIADPSCRVRGIFKTLFAQVMARVFETPMQYCFFDFVTNHDLSQKSVNHYGNVDIALLVGCQRKDTQARLEHLGLGKDPEIMDRYSILCGVVPRVPQPFGSAISVPGVGGEVYDFLLRPLNLQWTPRTRFDQIAKAGEYSIKRNPPQNSVEFDLSIPGYEALSQIIEDWRHLLREGYLHATVVTPMDQVGLRQVYDELTAQGFLIAGFLPYQFSDRLALVMQSVGPARVDWNNIRVHSNGAKSLKELIRLNYEGNLR